MWLRKAALRFAVFVLLISARVVCGKSNVQHGGKVRVETLPDGTTKNVGKLSDSAREDNPKKLVRVESHGAITVDPNSDESQLKPDAKDFADFEEVEHDDNSNAHSARIIIEHHFLGCFPLDDESETPQVFHTLDCLNASSKPNSSCHGGLPFFSLPLAPGQSYIDCFTFCLSKGLDLSGLADVKQEGKQVSLCRCGASRENAGAWHRHSPIEELLLHKAAKLEEDDPNCRLLVWEFTGGLTDENSVPYPLLQMSVDDMKYIESIALGHDVTAEDHDDDEVPEAEVTADLKVDMNDTRAHLSLLAMKGICLDNANVDFGSGRNCADARRYGWCNSAESGAYVRGNCPLTCGVCSKKGGFLPCYPTNCGGGGGPWLTKNANGLAEIKYFFDNVDNARKEVFRKAVLEFHEKTCIRLIESPSSVLPPRVSVGAYNLKSCSSGVGYPGAVGTLKINLGWCKDLGSLGSVIHEIGHAVGMMHEQSRLDGSVKAMVDGVERGPHIVVKWQNIGSEWIPQWLPSSATYVGSNYQQKGDVAWGYQPYDFESLMHYPGGGREFDTIPRSFNSVPGQQTGLSDGDVLQIEDMYQCGGDGGGTTTMKPTTTTTTQPRGKCVWWCYFAWASWKTVCRWEDCNGCRECAWALLDRKVPHNETTSDSSKTSSGHKAGHLDVPIALWVADSWGSCQKGHIICTRSREVLCKDTEGKVIADAETMCNPHDKPPSFEACHCNEVSPIPDECKKQDSSFDGESCEKWHGNDCFGDGTTDVLRKNCPHACGLC